MVRRIITALALTCVLSSQSFSLIQREIGGSGSGGGGGGGVTLSWPIPVSSEEEPYRNADMGPLGVVLSNGEFHITVTDMEVPGRGMPFRLTRTYRSKKDALGSLIGWNWHLSYDEYLHFGQHAFQDANGQTFTVPAIRWTMDNGWHNLWIDFNDGTSGNYVAFGGFYGKIRPITTSPYGWQIRYPDGMVKTFGQWILHPNGTQVWVLTRIEDRNGNVIAITFKNGTQTTTKVIDKIVDTLGRAYTFGYDDQDRLTSVTDFSGRRIDYSYDTNDNLTSVKAPEVRLPSSMANSFSSAYANNFCEPASAECPRPRKTTTYAYDTGAAENHLKHNLHSITDAKGQTFLTNYYGGTTAECSGDCVDHQVYGGNTVSYSYEVFPPNPPNPNPPASLMVARTTVTDRRGNIQEHEFNNQGNPLTVRYKIRTSPSPYPLRTFSGPEQDYVEKYTYVDNGTADKPMLMSQKTEAGGFNVGADGGFAYYDGGTTIQYNYDQTNPDIFQRGNLRSIVRTPGPPSGTARSCPNCEVSLSTSYSYEPLFNQPIEIQKPPARVTQYTYDYQEGSYADLMAGSPLASIDSGWWLNNEIENFLCNGGGACQGQGSKGDLNGDGILGPGGVRRGGNLIRVVRPSATEYDGTTRSVESLTVYNNYGLPKIFRDAENRQTHLSYFSEADPDGDSITTTSPAPDGRTLSGTSGADGGGFPQREILDAVPDPSLPGTSSGPYQNIDLTFTYDDVGNIETATDGRGIRTDYFLNQLNQIVQITYAAHSTATGAPALKYREQSEFDANNNIVKHRVERRDDGSTTQVNKWITKDNTYDILDRKESETIWADEDGNGVPDIMLTTTYRYDANGNLRKTIFPLGNAILRFYDERNLLYEEVVLKNLSIDPNAMTFSPSVDSVAEYDYDGSGNVIQLTDPEGHRARMGYDGYNRKVVGFDPAFQKSTFTYDDGSNLIEQRTYGTLGGATPVRTGGPSPADPKLSHQWFYYDELGRLRRTDTSYFKGDGTLGDLIRTDSNAGLTTVAPGDPGTAIGDGISTRLIAYDGLGRVVKIVDDRGNLTETQYDGVGRRKKIFLPLVAPFVLSPTDERNATEWEYDANGNVTAMVETEYGLDRSVSPAWKLPAQQHRTEFKYDAINRLVESRLVGRISPTAALVDLVTTYEYDSRGNKKKVTDPALGRTIFYYDGLNRLTRTEGGYIASGATESAAENLKNNFNSDGMVTTIYSHDDNGRLLSVKDDNLKTTSFQYDCLGRKTHIFYPGGASQEFQYDKDSLITLWEYKSSGSPKWSVSTQYDALHRAFLKDATNNFTGPTAFIGTRREQFEFDGLGRMTKATADADLGDGEQNVDSTVALAYNSRGKVITETQSFRDTSSGSAVVGTNVVTSTYDGVGFRTRLLYPGGRDIFFAPDALNRVDTLDLVGENAGKFQYDYVGPSRVLNRQHYYRPNLANPDTLVRLSRLTLLNGPSDDVAAGYDGARRVVDYAHKNDAGTDLARFAYEYDSASNRKFERRLHECQTGTCVGGESVHKGERYEYDALYRLTKRTEGNLDVTNEITGTPTVTQQYTVLDGLGNWKAHKKDAASYTNTINSLNQYTIFKDAQGQRNLYYDGRGNVINESLSENEQQYDYDYANRLISYLSASWDLTTYRYDALGRRISKTLNSVWTHTRFVYDGDRLIEERDGANGLVTSYVYGNGVDEILTRRRLAAGTWSDIFYHSNALGSVAAVTSSSGEVLERYKYDAYGIPTFLNPTYTPLTSSVVSNNILFSGRYFDTESGTYYYRARTYHPRLGRFLQRDPLGEAASLNLYAYVFNNPVNATDPSGMLSATYFGGNQSLYQDHMAYLGMSGGLHQDSGRNFLRTGRTYLVSYGSAEFRDLGEMYGAEDEAQAEEAERAAREDHEQRVAAHAAKKKADLDGQVQASKNDITNQKNMASPKGVAVGVTGILQDVPDTNDSTDIDEMVTKKQEKGYVTFVVEGDLAFETGSFSEPSQSALEGLANAVKAVSDKGGGNIPIEIDTFSHGAGPALALAGMLVAMGIDKSYVNVTTWDGYASGKVASTYLGAGFSLTVNTRSGGGLLDFAAGFVGLRRDFYGSWPNVTPNNPWAGFSHGNMDSQYPNGPLP